jgi:hypothetical protein
VLLQETAASICSSRVQWGVVAAVLRGSRWRERCFLRCLQRGAKRGPTEEVRKRLQLRDAVKRNHCCMLEQEHGVLVFLTHMMTHEAQQACSGC